MSALIITGMHRSGTSLTASFVQSIGVDIGQNMFPADPCNVKGYFEDIDFLEFQRSLLQASCIPGDPGWPDWGWTESETLDRSIWETYTDAAKELIAQRDRDNDLVNIWGWKDPRTSLLLEFWHQLLPNARYVLVYRSPWDVVDSILRQNRGVFPQRPDYALKSWGFYNRHLLSFYRQHRDRCILLNVNGFVQQPTRLVELLESQLGLRVKEPWDAGKFQAIYDANLLQGLDENHPMVRLVNHLMPQFVDLMSELEQVADIPRFDPSLSPPLEGRRRSEGETILPLEALPLSLHYQAIVQQQASQQEQIQLRSEVAQLQSELERLTHEIMAIKRSRSWKLSRKLSRLTQISEKFRLK